MKFLLLAMLCLFGTAHAAVLESVRLVYYLGDSYSKGDNRILHDGDTNVQVALNDRWTRWDYVDGFVTYHFIQDADLSFGGYGVHDPSIPVAHLPGLDRYNWLQFISTHGEFLAGDTRTVQVIPEPSIFIMSALLAALGYGLRPRRDLPRRERTSPQPA